MPRLIIPVYRAVYAGLDAFLHRYQNLPGMLDRQPGLIGTLLLVLCGRRASG